MASLSSERINPAYITNGFKLRRRLDGAASGGFGESPDQATLVHTRGWRYEDWSFPLMVHVTSAPAKALDGTEHRPGQPVDLGIAGVTAVYHDGVWALDAERAEVEGVDQAMYWNTVVHSLTVRTPTLVYGIRAPLDVGLAELIRVARSLPLAR
jgi:hypothetical protein